MPAACGGSAIPDLTHSQSNFHQISQRFLLCVGLAWSLGVRFVDLLPRAKRYPSLQIHKMTKLRPCEPVSRVPSCKQFHVLQTVLQTVSYIPEVGDPTPRRKRRSSQARPGSLATLTWSVVRTTSEGRTSEIDRTWSENCALYLEEAIQVSFASASHCLTL